ncbi:MAG: bifunctional metallophosphatase/5'-nucleotidase [Acholeplasmatales bacterium]|nr:bifunctional metallophosphatase/5'-nucleotidase [Acholeplasmatales bacterium]
MKKVLCLIMALFSLMVFASCGKNNNSLKIVYTNDIHSYIANTVKDSDGNEVDGIRLNNLSGYIKELKKENNVLVVDAGDQVQGAIYGAIDQGVDIINMMNAVGYDLATPGNHDFDYGVEAFNGFVKEAKFPYISCNFKKVEDDKNVLDSTKVFEVGNLKIGFVGISTPETITTSTPTFFQNGKGEFIYKFAGESKKEDLYNSVQKAIDEIKNSVDYVIALGHLGVGIDEEKRGIRSIDVINNTTGIDAFIDGHSHTLMEKKIVKSKDNKDVVLTQTGSYLAGVGVMDISKDGTINTTIVNSIKEKDDTLKVLEDNLIKKVNDKLGQKIAVLDKNLIVNNPNVSNQRIIRARETNLGDISSDSVYWYLNESKGLDCDIAITNGGGIRTSIESGDVTYLSCKSVMPFGNQVCLIKTKGQNIKDAIEMGVSVIGEWDKEWNCPAENGGFIHPAGLKYDVDSSIPSSVEVDNNGMFVSVKGEYRVKNLMIYNKNTKQYELLNENKDYLVGGINYLLRNSGNGLSMFKNSELVLDYIDEDYTVFAKYLMAFDKDDDYAHIINRNSPLKKYANYLYDYENPYGSGRINLLNIQN